MKKIIVGNWKCNPLSLAEAKALFNSFKKQIILSKENIEVVICPPFIYISEIRKILSKRIQLGAQDCFWQEKGAFTGEISPRMLRNLDCQYVILGHSERRNYLKEDNQIILNKTKASLKFGLKPILCIGEKEKDKKEGRTFDVLKSQIKETIGEISSNKLTNIIIAYEPVWAIGTGDNCPPNETMTILMFIKKQLIKNFSKRISEKIPILYGGSVNTQNAKCYIDAGFNGLLVGGVSLKPGDFAIIIKKCTQQDG